VIKDLRNRKVMWQVKTMFMDKWAMQILCIARRINFSAKVDCFSCDNDLNRGNYCLNFMSYQTKDVSTLCFHVSLPMKCHGHLRCFPVDDAAFDSPKMLRRKTIVVMWMSLSTTRTHLSEYATPCLTRQLSKFCCCQSVVPLAQKLCDSNDWSCCQP